MDYGGVSILGKAPDPRDMNAHWSDWYPFYRVHPRAFTTPPGPPLSPEERFSADPQDDAYYYVFASW